jgi:N-acetylglucosamine-6-phosphate deacetylase
MSNIGFLAITNGKVLTPMRVIDDGTLLIQGDSIVQVGTSDEVQIPENAKVYDAKGKYISPGFVDIHVHGGGGGDATDGSKEAIYKMARAHAAGGTTSFLATTFTAGVEKLNKSLEVIEETVERKIPNGAKVLGCHMEGPYFNIKQAGAQNPKYLKEPDPKDYLGWIDKFKCIKRISAAPELPGGLELGQELRRRGIMASIGHSEATYQQVVEAVEAGYTHVTHLYSGMSMVRRVDAYRVAGLVEASLVIDELTVEVIADGHHIPPSMLKLAIKAKGMDKICLITDAMSSAGLGAGNYDFGGLDVVVESRIPPCFEIAEEEGNYVAKLADRSAFAGSVATMDQVVRTMTHQVGLSILDAVKMATINSAKFIGIQAERGALVPGMKADVVLFDNAITPYLTIVEGEVVFDREKNTF